MGFEPTRGDPIGLAGRRLNHSAKVSLGSSIPGCITKHDQMRAIACAKRLLRFCMLSACGLEGHAARPKAVHMWFLCAGHAVLLSAIVSPP